VNYEPRPIATEEVVLPDELIRLTERLAEHNHDVWAAQRMAEGWTQGPRRDDVKKEHPGLVPYAALPESEKEYDRATALGCSRRPWRWDTGSSGPAERGRGWGPARAILCQPRRWVMIPGEVKKHWRMRERQGLTISKACRHSQILMRCPNRRTAVSDSVVNSPAEAPPHAARKITAPATPKIGKGRSSYDLFDDPTEIKEKWPLLDEVLSRCEQVIGPAYAESDNLAGRFQKWHQLITGVCAIAATAAVLFGIVQLAFPEPSEWLALHVPALEVFCAVTAGTLVVLASFVALKLLWMVGRHRTERLRMAKFRFLIDPETWCGESPLAARLERLEDEVRLIRGVTHASFLEWAEGAIQHVEPPRPFTCPLSEGAPLDQLIDYYRTKRLNYQRVYFSNCVKLFGRMDMLTRWVVPLLFYGSVLCVLAHFVFETWSHGQGLHDISRVLLFLAASLPAVAGGLRALRAANEYSRNRTRYRTAALALTHLDEILMRPKPPEDKLRDMDFCEQTLDLEHREWGRLMIESEIMP